ncbi:MAG: hypothetical protein U5J64_06890 [Halobacteriales archaeon]|nr:hypothetical protein [Halobacteriales archaeon]
MNVSRVAYLAVLSILFLALLTQPALAEPVSEEHVNIQEIMVVEEDEKTTVSLEYETSFSVRVSTFLFGSDSLEERLIDVVGVDEDDTVFVRLNSESAELIYYGDAGDISPETGEYSLLVTSDD